MSDLNSLVKKLKKEIANGYGANMTPHYDVINRIHLLAFKCRWRCHGNGRGCFDAHAIADKIYRHDIPCPRNCAEHKLNDRTAILWGLANVLESLASEILKRNWHVVDAVAQHSLATLLSVMSHHWQDSSFYKSVYDDAMEIYYDIRYGLWAKRS